MTSRGANVLFVEREDFRGSNELLLVINIFIWRDKALSGMKFFFKGERYLLTVRIFFNGDLNLFVSSVKFYYNYPKKMNNILFQKYTAKLEYTHLRECDKITEMRIAEKCRVFQNAIKT